MAECLSARRSPDMNVGGGNQQQKCLSAKRSPHLNVDYQALKHSGVTFKSGHESAKCNSDILNQNSLIALHHCENCRRP